MPMGVLAPRLGTLDGVARLQPAPQTPLASEVTSKVMEPLDNF